MNKYLQLIGVILCAQWLSVGSVYAADGALKAGKLYGDMICMMSDPKTWEGMFDEQTPEQKAAEEARMAKFYKDHGYAGEKDASVDAIKHWGKQEFKDAVNDSIKSQPECAKRVADKKLPLQKMLDGPAPKVK